MIDVTAVHRAFAELLTDVQRRRAWRLDREEYSARAVGGPGAHIIAGLDPDRLEAAALNLDIRRVTSPPVVDVSSLDQSAWQPARAVRGWPLPDRARVGLGFWPDLYVNFEGSDLVQVWEHRVDDYVSDARLLAEMANRGPVAIHSVGLSLGTTTSATDPERLTRIGRALRAAGASEFSDHLAFSRIDGIAMEHFAPIWRVEETLRTVVDNVNRIQDFLGVRLALENVAPIVDLGGELTVAGFLNEVVDLTGCGVLFDVTNLMLCQANGFCDATSELEMLNLEAVIGIHLAGGDEVEGIYFDAHAFKVAECDLAVLAQLKSRIPNCRSVILERDDRRAEVAEITRDLRAVSAAVG
jgi:uncharacterized protein